MSVVVVELIKADPSSMSAFVEHLVEAGIGQERMGSPQVQVNSFAESVMIGKVIAAFIEATPGSYELRAASACRNRGAPSSCHR